MSSRLAGIGIRQLSAVERSLALGRSKLRRVAAELCSLRRRNVRCVRAGRRNAAGLSTELGGAVGRGSGVSVLDVRLVGLLGRRAARVGVLGSRRCWGRAVGLLGSVGTLLGVGVGLAVGLRLAGELGLCVCVASDAGGGLRVVGLGHGGAAGLGGDGSLVLLAAEEEEDTGSDEGEADDGTDDCAGDPCLGL